MKQIERHRLKNNWLRAKELWKIKKSQFKLVGWKLVSRDMDDKVGLCSYKLKTIYLSTVFMRGSNCNYNKVKKALYHEIAHALCPGCGHGKTWKKMCRSIGGDDRLACTMMPPGRNWSMSCGPCGWRNEYVDKPSINGIVCMECKRPPRLKQIQ